MHRKKEKAAEAYTIYLVISVLEYLFSFCPSFKFLLKYYYYLTIILISVLE